MHGTQGTTKKPDATQLEPTKWVNKNTSSAIVSIAKPKDDRRITVDVHVLGKKLKALLISNEKSVDLNSQNVGEHLHISFYTCAQYEPYWHSDVEGLFHFKDVDVIQTGTKARWTLDWIVFYHDEWDMSNFTACVRNFPPAFSVLKSG